MFVSRQNVSLSPVRTSRDRMRGYRLDHPEVTGPGTTFFVDSNHSLRRGNIHANRASGFSPASRKASLAALGGLDAIIGSTDRPGFGMAADQTLAKLGVEPDWEAIHAMIKSSITIR